MGKEWFRRSMTLQVVDLLREAALGEPAELLKPELRRRLKLHWHYEAAHRADILGNGKSGHQFGQPVAIDAHVVVGKRDDLALGNPQAAISCVGGPRQVLTEVSHSVAVAKGSHDHISGSTRPRAVVD